MQYSKFTKSVTQKTLMNLSLRRHVLVFSINSTSTEHVSPIRIVINILNSPGNH